MNVIIYGFSPWINEYEMKDICFFLLAFAVMLVLQGRMIERNQIQHQYMQLIRFGRMGTWWKRICNKVMLLSVMMVAVLFGGMALFNAMFQAGHFSDGVLLPILLWCFSMICIGYLQLLMSLVPRGLYLSFLICVGFEVLCLYAGLFIEDWIGILPGSFMMLRRTSMLDGVMPIAGIIMIDVVFVVCVRIIGYRMLKRSCR